MNKLYLLSYILAEIFYISQHRYNMEKKEILALDATDLRILRLLQINSKLTNKEIAEEVGLTITPVYERIKRLEENGFIRHYRAELDRHLLGFEMIAFCNVSLKEHNRNYLDEFEKAVEELHEVVECYHIAGMFDYLLKVVITDMPAYHSFIIDKLAALDNIGNVQSMFVMKEIKEGKGYNF
jgi:Lrp/AsnC family leucine-responsive transcriptional regulator